MTDAGRRLAHVEVVAFEAQCECDAAWLATYAGRSAAECLPRSATAMAASSAWPRSTAPTYRPCGGGRQGARVQRSARCWPKRSGSPTHGTGDSAWHGVIGAAQIRCLFWRWPVGARSRMRPSSPACRWRRSTAGSAMRAFRAEVMKTRREMWTEAVGQLTAACTEAVDALRALLKDPVASARLGAAKTILEASHKGVELLELEQRLAAVEGRLESQHRDGRCGVSVEHRLAQVEQRLGAAACACTTRPMREVAPASRPSRPARPVVGSRGPSWCIRPWEGPMGLETRLARVEQAVRPAACPACSGPPTRFELAASGAVPAPCPRCGRPPFTFTITLDPPGGADVARD